MSDEINIVSGERASVRRTRLEYLVNKKEGAHAIEIKKIEKKK